MLSTNLSIHPTESFHLCVLFYFESYPRMCFSPSWHWLVSMLTLWVKIVNQTNPIREQVKSQVNKSIMKWVWSGSVYQSVSHIDNDNSSTEWSVADLQLYTVNLSLRKVVGLSLSICNFPNFSKRSRPKPDVLNWRHKTVVLMVVLHQASKFQNS